MLREIKLKTHLVFDISELWWRAEVWEWCVCICTSLKPFDDIEKDIIFFKGSPQRIQLW